MGTNYYYHKSAPCEYCGRQGEPRHIGKSSCGWCFSLHIYPDDGINDLPDWLTLFAAPGSQIKDEYGDVVTPEEMFACITIRGPREVEKVPAGYASWDDFHINNGSEPGPNGMLRHRIGWHCVSHGEGTWDCLAHEFS